MTARYDWTINQGETSEINISVTDSGGSDVNFAQNTTFRMQAKKKFGGEEVLKLTTNGTADTHFQHTLSAGDSYSASNDVKVVIPATLTAAIPAPGTYVYDIEQVTGTTVKRLIEGSLIVTPEVTTITGSD